MFTSSRVYEKNVLPDRSNAVELKDAMMVSFLIVRTVHGGELGRCHLIEFDAKFALESSWLPTRLAAEEFPAGFFPFKPGEDDRLVKKRRKYCYTAIPGGVLPAFTQPDWKCIMDVKKHVRELFLRPENWERSLTNHDRGAIDGLHEFQVLADNKEESIREIDRVSAQLLAYEWIPRMLRIFGVKWNVGPKELYKIDSRWPDSCARFVDSFKELSLAKGPGLHYVEFDEIMRLSRE